jgi:hypothetical protein
VLRRLRYWARCTIAQDGGRSVVVVIDGQRHQLVAWVCRSGRAGTKDEELGPFWTLIGICARFSISYRSAPD